MTSSIGDFPEKKIRNSILNKATPGRINKNGPHWKGYIYIGDKLVAKVKIPNDHPRVMKSSKSQYIARDLKLSEEQFNDFVQCTLRGSAYYEMLANFL